MWGRWLKRSPPTTLISPLFTNSKVSVCVATKMYTLSFYLSLFIFCVPLLVFGLQQLVITLKQGITRFLLTLIPHFRKVYTIQPLIFIYSYNWMFIVIIFIFIIPLCRFCCQPLNVHIVVRGKLYIYIFQISNLLNSGPIKNYC